VARPGRSWNVTSGDAEFPGGPEVLAAWEALAGYWDESMSGGRTWQRTLIAPAVERLLELRSGERVLEIACGNGEFSRRMADLGARVLATDFSEGMLRRARARGADGIDYRRADATNEEELLALGEPGEFDAVVCNMAIMDMTDIGPMAAAGAVLLRPGGRFVFSTVHPAFNGNDTVRMVEEYEDDQGVGRRYSVKVSSYIRPQAAKGVALEDQPVVQWYFHRPMKDLFAAFFDRGYVLDGFDEPVLAPEDIPPRSTSPVFVEVPPVVVARMRPGTSAVPLN
jgi:2-polyprenyl-3-methyl-5-hydroxy-6-metoxy-1,4-benzoquinol methylase